MQGEYQQPPFSFIGFLAGILDFLLSITTGFGQGMGLLNIFSGFFGN